MKYGFIREHAKRWPVVHQCRLLGVQRSAYYAWRDRPCKVIPPEELALRRRMKVLFRASRDSLGSRTLGENLRDEGFKTGRDRTRRLMKTLNLKVKQKRKYKVTTDSKHHLPVAENVLNRQFSPQAPNQAWGVDITYLWTDEGWLYLAVVMDLYSRAIVGWSMDKRMTQQLVSDALTMALFRRHFPKGTIIHSDRGSQYCSKRYQRLIKNNGLLCHKQVKTKNNHKHD